MYVWCLVYPGTTNPIKWWIFQVIWGPDLAGKNHSMGNVQPIWFHDKSNQNTNSKRYEWRTSANFNIVVNSKLQLVKKNVCFFIAHMMMYGNTGIHTPSVMEKLFLNKNSNGKATLLIHWNLKLREIRRNRNALSEEWTHGTSMYSM